MNICTQTTAVCPHDSVLEMGRSSADAEHSAEELGRMFGSVTCDYSAEVRQTFCVICGFAFAAICTHRWR